MSWLTNLLVIKGATFKAVMIFTFVLILSVWGYDSVSTIYHGGHIQDLPKNVMELLMGGFLAKVGYRWVENKTPTTPTTPTTPPSA